MFLTHDNIVEMTGYKRPSAQLRWLAAHGYRCDVKRNGYPLIAEKEVERVLCGEHKEAPHIEPDFSGLE